MDKLQAGLAISLCALIVNAQAALFDDTEARKKILEVEAKSLANHQTQVVDIEDLNKRMGVYSQGMLDLQSEIELLKQEIAELRGALEVANHAVAMAERRQKDLYADTDARIRKLESGAPLASFDEDADVSGLAVNADAEIYKAYKHAYNLSQENKHKEAYEAFNVFITQYPDSKYTPDALYGLGYSQFALKNYQASMASQQKLLSIYPNSAKAPNAMYSIANSQIQLGQINNAKKALRDLIAKYPTAAVTPNAQARLKVLESIKADAQ